ncbi:DUF3046 domain-containing protein [Protaetiibacter larvae]|uniref:DUF3046 domain-containing protein n=1 Tax=Protaetiibacter larvae TaxID=2592654 RepID=A0A5C1Y705_9MICO|nr:DUF3046 domain-containing protein [Protaetiibacter larvae]QEO09863.1 DUF3046 domain-containing protein [Protaetiibacter larvae]
MKNSEFRRAVDQEFGPGFGRVLVTETVVLELGNRTPEAALTAGVPASEVWIALCRSQDVPRERWHGAGLPQPRKH